MSNIPQWEYAAVIPAAGTTSAAVKLDVNSLVGVIIPSGFEGSSISVQGATKAAPETFLPLRDATGQTITLTGFSAGDWVVIPAGAVSGVDSVRFVAGTTQAAERTLTAILRPFQ